MGASVGMKVWIDEVCIEYTLMADFWVGGIAKVQGSKKAFGYMKYGRMMASVVDDNKDVKPWRNSVASQAQAAWGTRPLIDGPVALRLDFVRLRPASHLRANGIPKPSAPAFPDTIPDLSKVERAVEDALTGVIYIDDRKICGRMGWKVWGDKPGVRIQVYTIGNPLTDKGGR